MVVLAGGVARADNDVRFASFAVRGAAAKAEPELGERWRKTVAAMLRSDGPYASLARLVAPYPPTGEPALELQAVDRVYRADRENQAKKKGDLFFSAEYYDSYILRFAANDSPLARDPIVKSRFRLALMLADRPSSSTHTLTALMRDPYQTGDIEEVLTASYDASRDKVERDLQWACLLMAVRDDTHHRDWAKRAFTAFIMSSSFNPKTAGRAKFDYEAAAEQLCNGFEQWLAAIRDDDLDLVEELLIPFLKSHHGSPRFDRLAKKVRTFTALLSSLRSL